MIKIRDARFATVQDLKRVLGFNFEEFKQVISMVSSGFAPFEYIKDIESSPAKWLMKELEVMHDIEHEQMISNNGIFAEDKLK